MGAYCKSGEKPNDIPRNPYRSYADDWVNFADWLGQRITHRGGWRPFEEARTFVRSLGLKSHVEWQAYCKSGEKPDDIPTLPQRSYADDWVNLTDWLGNGKWTGDWRPFKEARAFVRSLGLKSAKEWGAYCKSGEKPNDIPRNPYRSYADDWVNLADWLGQRIRQHGRWRPFEEARTFVRSLGLKSQVEWQAYYKSGGKPDDIPTAPDRIYADDWVNLADWLGNGKRTGDWRPFEEALTFVRSLGLKSQVEWQAYYKSGEKPDDIPAFPQKSYADDWVNLADWLGNGKRTGDWRPFEEARTFVHNLGLKSAKEWAAYGKSGNRPDDIPAAPQRSYADDWVNLADWLGNGKWTGDWRPFEEARTFVHNLGLKSAREWGAYCKSGEKPDDIPAFPRQVYAGDWVNWPDWLGNGKWTGDWRPFEETRTFVRGLGLKSRMEWRAYCKSGEKPDDIPHNPDRSYAGDWVNWLDWLGNGKRAGDWRPFEGVKGIILATKEIPEREIARAEVSGETSLGPLEAEAEIGGRLGASHDTSGTTSTPRLRKRFI
jgi:3-mercaptopyruvate sulfurtransferase SseA